MVISCSEKIGQTKSTQTTTASTERFVNVAQSEILALNKKVKGDKVKTEEDIIGLYRPKSLESEGNYSYTISKKVINATTTEVTLIEDGLMDDAVLGQKTIMTVKKEPEGLTILAIKKNFKCRRGHKEWSDALCN